MNRSGFANRCCGLIKQLQNRAQVQGRDVTESLFGADTEVLQLAEDLRQCWPDRFGASYLKRSLKQKLSELTTAEVCGKARDEMLEFFDQLQSFDETKLCVAPLDGVELVNQTPVLIGPFTLRIATSTTLDSWQELLIRAMIRTRDSAAVQSDLAKHFRQDMDEQLLDRVVLEVEVSAEPERANSLFVETAGSLVDLLQVSTKIAQWCEDTRIGLRGRPHAGLYSFWVLPLKPGLFQTEHKWVGNAGRLQLTETNIELLRRAGIFALADALGRDQTPFERILFRAAHWFAQATLQDSGSKAILFLAICLETILGTSSSRAVAESVALLVGPNFAERKRIQSVVLAAYRVRNSVVHEGENSHVPTSQRAFLEVVLDVLTICIHLFSEVKESEGLRQRIEKLRFG